MKMFKKLKYYLLPRPWAKIEFDGNWVIEKIENIPSFFECVDGDDVARHKITLTWMTESQHDKLPEFDGF
jgi:hypothetical protein